MNGPTVSDYTIEFILDLCRESPPPIAIQIIERARQEDFQRTWYETWEQTRREVNGRWLHRALKIRFEVSATYLAEREIQRLKSETLEKLHMIALTVPTLAEFEAHLESLES